MSCLGKKYVPTPPREWVRFHNRCSEPDAPIFTLEEAYRLQMMRKGNILQYKANSAQWTKKERYWQLANRKFNSWASQTQTTSNPNTGLLKRINTSYIVAPQSSNIIDNNSVNSVQDADCIKTAIQNIINNLPDQPTNNIAPTIPPIPPQPTETNSTNVIPPYIEPEGVILYLIKNGGTLLCNQVVAPCSGQLLQEFRNGDCYPTSDSNVPGNIQLLCWSGRQPTYFPRVKRTYGTSGNKWPVNAKFIRSAT
jgi:hypothetical protein